MVAMSPCSSMPKPTTGFPVLAMPSTTHLGPAGLDADHHHGGDIGIGAGADQGAEMEIEILAELQAAIGMGNRQGALDVVGHRLARRIGQIVERQDDDVVAHADAAVFAAPSGDGGGHSSRLGITLDGRRFVGRHLDGCGRAHR